MQVSQQRAGVDRSKSRRLLGRADFANKAGARIQRSQRGPSRLWTADRLDVEVLRPGLLRDLRGQVPVVLSTAKKHSGTQPGPDVQQAVRGMQQRQPPQPMWIGLEGQVMIIEEYEPRRSRSDHQRVKSAGLQRLLCTL